MKKFAFLSIVFLISSILFGCDDKLNELKDAVSGIDSAANKAANAISLDAHSIRSVEINYENHTFIINDLFKTILRDTLWEYEQKDTNHILIVKGTWKEPLFENYNITVDKEKLKKDGKVTIELQFENETINEHKTNVILEYEKNKLLELKGKEALHYLYDVYIQKYN